jgi:hypothetical protein
VAAGKFPFLELDSLAVLARRGGLEKTVVDPQSPTTVQLIALRAD